MNTMKGAFTKLFASITSSTLWFESSDVRIVWITMMAMADRDGIVSASVPGLAHIARVDRAVVDEALKKFQSPDPDSRSPENEGRRIQAVEGGWQLLNYEKYRNLMNAESIRQSKRQWAARHRLAQKTGANLNVPVPTPEEVVAYGTANNIGEALCRRFHEWNTDNSKWAKTNGEPIDWKACLSTWKLNEEAKTKSRQTLKAILPYVDSNGVVRPANPNPAPNRAPLWAQIKALEKIVEDINYQREKIMVDPNDPPDVVESCKAKRKELRTKRDEQLKLISELNARIAQGEA